MAVLINIVMVFAVGQRGRDVLGVSVEVGERAEGGDAALYSRYPRRSLYYNKKVMICCARIEP